MSEYNGDEDVSIAARKSAAAELRKIRKAIRDPRNRLFSDSSADEVPKGILKNARIPTKRSASECVEDLSQIMEDLNLSVTNLPNSKFCPHHHMFIEETKEDEYEYNEDDDDDFEYKCEECVDEDDDDDDDDDDGDDDEVNKNDEDDGEEDGEEDEEERKQIGNMKQTIDTKQKNGEKQNEKAGALKRCDCKLNQSDRDKPKKSVRFDDHVNEVFFFAARLYDRRNFSKYHFSSRHHPPKQQNKSSKQKKGKLSKEKSNGVNDEHKQNQHNKICKQTKSQRARQSKKDKKRNLTNKREEQPEANDDLGYCSSMNSFSD